MGPKIQIVLGSTILEQVRFSQIWRSHVNSQEIEGDIIVPSI